MRTGEKTEGVIHRENKKVGRRKEEVVAGAGPWGHGQRAPCRSVTVEGPFCVSA